MQTSVRGARTSYALPLVAVATLIVVVVGGAFLLSRGPSANVGTPPGTATASPSQPSPSTDSSVTPSLAPRAVETAAFDVPAPYALDATDQTVWATSAGGVVRIDPGTGEMTRIQLPEEGANGIVATDAAVWVSGFPANSLYRIDPDTGEVTTIELETEPITVGLLGNEIVVTLRDGTAIVDAATNAIVRSFDVQAYAAFESLWTVQSSAVSRRDPTDGSVIATIQLPPPVNACQLSPLSDDGMPELLVVGCFEGELLTVIDAVANEVVDTYDVGTNGGTAIAIDGGWWSSVEPVEDGGFARIDPDTGAVLDLVDLGEGNGPSGMDTTSTDLWIVSEPNEQVLRIPLSEFTDQ